MKIWFALYNGKMFLNPINLIRKLLRKKYIFLKKNKNNWNITCWNDRLLGHPFPEQTVKMFEKNGELFMSSKGKIKNKLN